jgi:hypothetical protein
MSRHGGGPRGICCSSRGAVQRLHFGPTTTPASMQDDTPADACTPSDSVIKRRLCIIQCAKFVRQQLALAVAAWPAQTR